MAAVKQSARSRRSYGKIGDCKQYIYQFHKPINITYITALQVCTLSAFSLSSASFIHWSLLISTPFAFKDVTAKEEGQKAMLVYCSYQGRGVGGSIQRSLVRGANPLGLGARGGSRIFFRRGCTRLLLYFKTNKPHSFFLQNTSCIRKPQVISGRGAHPLHPPPRSAPGNHLGV